MTERTEGSRVGEVTQAGLKGLSGRGNPGGASWESKARDESG